MSEANPQSIALQASQAFQNKNYGLAADLYQKAILKYESDNDLLNAAEMKNNLCVVLLKLNQPEAALRAVTGTDIIFQKSGDIRRQAIATGNLASTIDATGDHVLALDKYTSANNLLKSIGEKEYRAIVLQSMSSLQIQSGKYLDALVSMKFSLDLRPTLSLRQKILRWLLSIPFSMLGQK